MGNAPKGAELFYLELEDFIYYRRQSVSYYTDIIQCFMWYFAFYHTMRIYRTCNCLQNHQLHLFLLLFPPRFPQTKTTKNPPTAGHQQPSILPSPEVLFALHDPRSSRGGADYRAMFGSVLMVKHSKNIHVFVLSHLWKETDKMCGGKPVVVNHREKTRKKALENYIPGRSGYYSLGWINSKVSHMCL